MDFDKFMQTYKIGGSYSAPDGTYKGQCVSLCKLYFLQVLGFKPQSIGNAKDYWSKRNSKYLTKHFIPKTYYKGFVAQRGDVFVRTSGTYGHMGIVISATKDYFIAFEQNNGGCLKVKKIKHTYENMQFLRPKDQTNVVKSNKPSIKKGDKVEVLYARYFYKVYGDGYRAYTIQECTKMDYLYKVKFKKGATFKVLEVDGNMCKVSYGSKEGWIGYYDAKINRANVKKK